MMVETTDAPRRQVERQLLEALETTYPGWTIITDEQWWIAELRQQQTPGMAELGIVQYVRRTSGESLGDALQRQAELLHSIGPALFL